MPSTPFLSFTHSAAMTAPRANPCLEKAWCLISNSSTLEMYFIEWVPAKAPSL